ncbi:calcium-binding and coiled-coil domain-containing protein 1-like [Neocloeon triangulifer]|uniref:calcium-binding and coiled-coil domain-containing protein 1-like n=1 Tax=Neocloeon triangulifer TaxID=2078957 RepID=UPI00286EF283|nr:calcium-binding and coiled-coil domain-containing protein 1-like [Neocloeon triangulifer]
MEFFFQDRADDEFNLDVFHDDIKRSINSLGQWKQKIASMENEITELKKREQSLQKALAEARENEKNERASVIKLTEDFGKLQTSLDTMIEVKVNNAKLAERAKMCERQVSELSKRLENERHANEILMQKTCTEIANQGSKDLQAAQAEIEHLHDQLRSNQEELRKTNLEYQAKMRNLERSRKEELRQTALEYQDKIESLQSELQSTRTHCRDLQEKIKVDSTNFQKKIKDLERTSMNPFLRAPEKSTSGPGRNKVGGRKMPTLDFVNSTSDGEKGTDNQSYTNQSTLRKRKLFVQSNDNSDDDFM